LLSELLDALSPQHFLAERMITIVTYFRSEAVKFIFRRGLLSRLSSLPSAEPNDRP
jgi:hypothetical protein